MPTVLRNAGAVTILWSRGWDVAMAARMACSAGDGGMYSPPPIQVHPGAISKYSPAPSCLGNPRGGNTAAAFVLSGVLSLENRVSR